MKNKILYVAYKDHHRDRRGKIGVTEKPSVDLRMTEINRGHPSEDHAKAEFAVCLPRDLADSIERYIKKTHCADETSEWTNIGAETLADIVIGRIVREGDKDAVDDVARILRGRKQLRFEMSAKPPSQPAAARAKPAVNGKAGLCCECKAPAGMNEATGKSYARCEKCREIQYAREAKKREAKREERARQ